MRQQLDAITLAGLARELDGWLAGARVSKVFHPSADEFLIAFWGGPVSRPDDRNIFYVNLNRQQPFCTLIDNADKRSWVRPDFAKPTALCMLLRKHLHNATLAGIETLDGERVLNLAFDNFNELGNRVRLVLSLELMGKHSNMLLVDDVQATLIAVAHGVSDRMSSHRELAAGLPYAPPPRPPGKRLLQETTFAQFEALMRPLATEPPAEMAIALNSHFQGLARPLVEAALAESIPAPDDFRALYDVLQQLVAGHDLHPALHRARQRFSIVPPHDTQSWQAAGWEALESCYALSRQYFVENLACERIEQLRAKLCQTLERALRRLAERENTLKPMDDTRIRQLQDTGDRLLAAYSSREVTETFPPQGHITLTYYETGEPWVIEVDPALSWVDNAQLYYRRARKAKRQREAADAMGAELQGEQAYQAELLQLVRQAESMDELTRLQTELPSTEGVSAPRKPNAAEPTVMSLVTPEGWTILIGKTAEANAHLVGRLARADDLWLHAHHMPGSHVLIRMNQPDTDNQPPDAVLLAAAQLAAHYSAARGSANVPVIYTQARHVRKIPRSYPGHVTYKHEKTLFVTPDAARIKALLNSLS